MFKICFYTFKVGQEQLGIKSLKQTDKIKYIE